MIPAPWMSDPVQVGARTAWGEARGEGNNGMAAVLCVGRNRASRPAWWGHDLCSVFLHPWQFSCWNAADVNLPKILTITDMDPQFREAIALAQALVGGHLTDMTKGADHYYDTRSPRPAWASSQFYCCTIGHHAFYRVGPFGEG